MFTNFVEGHDLHFKKLLENDLFRGMKPVNSIAWGNEIFQRNFANLDVRVSSFNLNLRIQNVLLSGNDGDSISLIFLWLSGGQKEAEQSRSLAASRRTPCQVSLQ